MIDMPQIYHKTLPPKIFTTEESIGINITKTNIKANDI